MTRSATLASSNSYDTFGAHTAPTPATAGRYGYTGEEIDTETGLVYLRARYYDPALGRFISPDPFLGRLAEPITQNRYVYVKNNPLGFTDPSGLADFDWQMAGKSAFGMVANGVEVVAGSFGVVFGGPVAPLAIYPVADGAYGFVQNARNFDKAITGQRGYVETSFTNQWLDSIGVEKNDAQFMTTVVDVVKIMKPTEKVVDLFFKAGDSYMLLDNLQNSNTCNQ